MPNMDERLSYEEFVVRAIRKLRNLDKSKGIHTVYSGFNNAFKKYFEVDPIPITQELANRGLIEMQPRRGGMMLYLPGEGPGRRANNPDDIIDEILSDE